MVVSLRLPKIELLTQIVEGVSGLRAEQRGFHCVETMKDLSKVVVFAVLMLALAPFGGFWIVALIGAGLLLLPIGAMIATFFPKTWHRFEESLFDKTHILSAP